MGSDALGAVAEQRGLPGLDRSRCHDLAQAELHRALARHRAYLHPYRWTSLGLSLLEAMTLGMPVLALATTEAPDGACPPAPGLVTNDLDLLRAHRRRWLADPDEAAAAGPPPVSTPCPLRLDRFLADWDRILKEVAP